MAISLQADSTLQQGYILIDGQRAATISPAGLSATVWGANAVTTNAITDGAVTASKIASGAVTTASIAASAITAEKMSGGQSGDAPVFGCRAWVNFDGTSVTNVGGEDRCTIRSSGNVSKVVRNGVSEYTIIFITGMPDANYAVNTTVNFGIGSTDFVSGISQTVNPTQNLYYQYQN